MRSTLPNLSVIGLLMMTVFIGATATAGDLDKRVFSFSGFGTVGVAHSSEKNADYSSSLFKPDGAGYSRDWSFDVDSLLGVQMDVNLTPKLSAVLQIIAEQRYDNTYKPTVEWANVKYSFTPDLSARVGRIVLPNFMVAEYRRVGYAMPWVRPPGDVYRISQVTSSDGVDMSYRLRIGEATNTLHGYFGRRDVHTIYDGNIIEARKLAGITNTVDYGAASVRFGYYQGRLSMPASTPLFDAFRSFGPRGIEIAERYELNDKQFQIVAVGANYDPGNWFLTGELAKHDTNSWLGDRTAWYVSGGYRFNRFTPYLIYSRLRPDSPTSDPGVPFAPAMMANVYLNALLRGMAADQTTIAVGARWDMAKNTALKVQYDRINIGAGSQGVFINTQPGYVPGGKVNVVSATLDFVF